MGKVVLRYWSCKQVKIPSFGSKGGLLYYRPIHCSSGGKSWGEKVMTPRHLSSVFVQKNGSLNEWKDRKTEVRDCHRVYWENSVGHKWYSYDASFDNKASIWWVLMWNKRQPGWTGDQMSVFSLAGLMGGLEVCNCDRNTLGKECWLKIFEGVCQKLWQR